MWETCHKCKGSGECQQCGGSGKERVECQQCGGRGRSVNMTRVLASYKKHADRAARWKLVVSERSEDSGYLQEESDRTPAASSKRSSGFMKPATPSKRNNGLLEPR